MPVPHDKESIGALWPGQPPGTDLACSIERQSVDYEVGLDAQYAANTRLAASEGYFIPDHPDFRFRDNDTSGVRRHRQGLDRFREVVLSPQGAPFKRGYTIERARAYRHRDPRRLFALELECEDHGVLIRYLDEPDPSSLDVSGAGDPARMGRFIGAAVKNVMTSEELEVTLRRTRKGRRWRVMNRYYPNSRTPYALDRWLVDMKTGEFLERIESGSTVSRDGCAYRLRWTDGPECDVVKRIFAAADAGTSLRRIARDLNDDGIPAPSARHPADFYPWATKPRWTPSSVWEMLHERLYMGDYVYPNHRRHGEPVLHTEADMYGHEPILYIGFMDDPPVERAQWFRVQEILRGHPRQGGRKRSDSAYLLGGLIVCAHCGAAFYGNRMHREREGERYLYYRHHTQDKAFSKRVCRLEGLMVNVAQFHRAALQITRAALADGGMRAEVATELRRQREFAGGQRAADELQRLRKAAVKYDAAADRAADNAALSEVASARLKHRQMAEKFAGLADAVRLQLSAAESAMNRFTAAEARLSTEALGDPDVGDELERADAVTRRRIVQSVIREVRVDLDACTAEFFAVAL